MASGSRGSGGAGGGNGGEVGGGGEGGGEEEGGGEGGGGGSVAVPALASGNGLAGSPSIATLAGARTFEGQAMFRAMEEPPRVMTKRAQKAEARRRKAHARKRRAEANGEARVEAREAKARANGAKVKAKQGAEATHSRALQQDQAPPSQGVTALAGGAGATPFWPNLIGGRWSDRAWPI